MSTSPPLPAIVVPDNAPPEPASPMEPQSPASKAALKNDRAYNKVLIKEAKAEEKKIKHAIKDGNSATKAEQKAAKEEIKAKRVLDKALVKEFKTNKKLLSVQAKHEKAVLDLEKAKAKLELKTTHHTTQTTLRDQKMQLVDSLRARGSVST
ncbi:hypothetical protein DFH28DRAFT_973862 [Melampsora americana]|nr:hypothetical protein DFH28DRAFT_973862 [Melampsora americana]